MSLPDQLDDAIRAEDAPTVNALLSEHPELVNGPDGVITPPLSIAIGVTGNLTVVSILLTHGANVEQICKDTGATPLKYAIVYTRLPILKHLIHAGADINNAAAGLHPVALAESLPNDEMRDMGITGTRSQYEEIARILRDAGAQSAQSAQE
ncbi:MAG: ankyrin repeat domain-containing protein [Pseudomonadota bacterium]